MREKKFLFRISIICYLFLNTQNLKHRSNIPRFSTHKKFGIDAFFLIFPNYLTNFLSVFFHFNNSSILFLRTVYGDGYGYGYAYTHHSRGITLFTYTDYYTQCHERFGEINCNTTLSEPTADSPPLTAPLPHGPLRQINLRCVSCHLDTFPNVILDSYFEWLTLNFDSSNIKYLNMSAINTTVADHMGMLVLSNNFITELDDGSLPTARYLYLLDLSHNLIRNVTGHRTFNKMERLITLDLSYNQIRYLDPLAFQNLRLQVVNLDNNRLLEMTFIAFFLPRIKLTLNNNPIESVDDINVTRIYLTNTSITNCAVGKMVRTLVITDGILETIDLSMTNGLTLLNLSANHLTHIEIDYQRQLDVLDLHDNRLETISLTHESHIPSINLARNLITNTINMSLPETVVDLNLSHNKIVDFGHDVFKNLKKLRYLDLAHCGLHTFNARIFIPIGITHLDLSYNRIAQIDLNIFKGFRILRQLNLNGNQLTDINVEDSSKNVQIGISRNPWNCTRLIAIVDILTRRNAIIFHEPCIPWQCQVNIQGIGCRNDNYVMDVTNTEAPIENSDADERFSDNEKLFWDDIEENINQDLERTNKQYQLKAHFNQDSERMDKKNLSTVVNEITLDLHSISKDSEHILKNGTEFDTNANHFNRNITKKFREISRRVKRLRNLTNRFLTEFSKRPADSVNLKDTNTHLGEPKAKKLHVLAITVVVMGIIVWLFAATFFGIISLRKRRAERNNGYTVTYSTGN